ncbi:hypothetical protein LIER_39165 [Lithospermum erythrorhizon]|uniref:Uncharacterized protein n=1 Tax=Lithospermum erythrorhizon TaxID=34254 RepID=A0AAV3QDT7_LITER
MSPWLTALTPRRLASFVFFDQEAQSYEDVMLFLSIRTNMVGFRFGDQFAVEAREFDSLLLKSLPVGPRIIRHGFTVSFLVAVLALLPISLVEVRAY